MQKIVTHLWFDTQAEEAAQFYVDTLNGAPGSSKNSKIVLVQHYPKAAEADSGKKVGTVMTVVFELDGQRFMTLNGGPRFTFSEAVSLVINCKDQAEIDYFWETLIADGGAESQCGWLKDKYGFSWQVAPENFDALASKDPATFEKVMAAILPMKKIIIKDLEDAAT